MQWIDTYSGADAVFAYSEFGRDTMLNQSNKIKFIDVASPCASEKFFKMNKAAIREEFDLDKDAIIFGTVMRNQRRKLYPDLLKAFRDFINETGRENAYLHLHTGYPDVGWDIPDLIKSNDLCSKVLITYKCKKCGKVTVSFFNEAVKFCHSCKSLSSQIVGISNKMDDTDLNKIYNLFDVYIQWANSEGWGMPQLEAAYAGLPVISVDYSAMSSLVHNIDGIWIEPIGFYKELETGCNRAVPNNRLLTDTMKLLCDNPDFRKNVANRCYDNARKIYNWDYTAQKWADYFVNTPVPDHSQTWDSPPRYFNPQAVLPSDIEQIPITDQVNWLFNNVLGKPEWINGTMWKRMVKDLMYRSSVSLYIPGYYFNDFAHPDLERRYEPFDIKKAHEIFVNMRNVMNQWENARAQRIGK
jgi:glycosyltransferase involved in cell wall biosynthesis